MLFYDANSSNHAANELASEIDTKFLSSSFPSSPLGLVKLNSCVFSFNFSAKKERKEERKRESLVYIYIRLYAKQVDIETVDDQRRPV